MSTPEISSAPVRPRSFLLTDRYLVTVYLTATSLIYFAFALYYARTWSFWYDELFTYYVASLPDVRTIWRSLLAGMDNHPPLDYIIRHYSMLLFGHSEVGARIPSIAAFYGAFLCVFYYARAAHSTLAGIIASSLLLGSPAAMYAVEGRGYALVLGFGATALLLWRRLSADRKAPLWMWAALGLCLAVSVWVHYYGLLIITVFAIAGMVDWIERRRCPMKLLITGSAACIAVLPVVPFAIAAKSYGAHFWAVPTSNPLQAIRDSIGNLGSPGAEVLLWVALCALLLRHAPAVQWFVPRWRAPTRMSSSEIALLVALLFGPLMQWLLARAVTNAYVWRYTITSIAAACVIGGFLLARGCTRNSTVALAVCLMCILQAPNSLLRLRLYRDSRQQVLAVVAALDTRLQYSTTALAAPHGNTYLAYYYYGSERLKKNLIMLSDEDAAIRLGHTDNNQIALGHLAKFLPIRFEPFVPFIAHHPRIDLTTGRYDPETWIVSKLLESGYRISLPATGIQGIMYNCEYR